jgi:hypothetical protein
MNVGGAMPLQCKIKDQNIIVPGIVSDSAIP